MPRTLATTCLLSIPRADWLSLDAETRSYIYPGLFALCTVVRKWLARKRSLDALIARLAKARMTPVRPYASYAAVGTHEVTESWKLTPGDHVVCYGATEYSSTYGPNGIFIGPTHSKVPKVAVMSCMENLKPRVHLVPYHDFVRPYQVYCIAAYASNVENPVPCARLVSPKQAAEEYAVHERTTRELKRLTVDIATELASFVVPPRSYAIDAETFASFCKTGKAAAPCGLASLRTRT